VHVQSRNQGVDEDQLNGRQQQRNAEAERTVRQGPAPVNASTITS
jgi:hypothetical protein